MPKSIIFWEKGGWLNLIGLFCSQFDHPSSSKIKWEKAKDESLVLLFAARDVAGIGLGQLVFGEGQLASYVDVKRVAGLSQWCPGVCIRDIGQKNWPISWIFLFSERLLSQRCAFFKGTAATQLAGNHEHTFVRRKLQPLVLSQTSCRADNWRCWRAVAERQKSC